MPQGTIKKLDSDRGFGFLQGTRGELFFHRSGLGATWFDQLQIGQTAEYSLEPSRGFRGARAIKVKLV